MDLPTIRHASKQSEDDSNKEQAEGEHEDEDESDNNVGSVEVKDESTQDGNDVATRMTAENKRKRDEEEVEQEDRTELADDGEEKEEHSTSRALQLDTALITLSTTPKAKWLTLSDLDQIKVCYHFSVPYID